MMLRRRYYNVGFTLVEVLMVVVIIAVLAAIIIPRFTGYVDRGVASSTKTNLQTLRSAVQAHYATRNNTWPSSNLSTLLTTAGGTLLSIPKEAVRNSNQVVNSYSGLGGWLYDTTSHDVSPNVSGTDFEGVAFASY